MNSDSTSTRSVDRLMVAVGPGPGFEKLVRLGRRTAVELNAPWLAVYVDTGRVLDDAERRQLACNLDLARALGAEVITTAGVDLAETLLRVAREKSVTRMIAGKPQPMVWWKGRGVRTPVDRLIRQSGEIEVDLVQRELPSVKPLPVLRWPAGGCRQTVWALFILAVVTLVGGGVERTLGYPSVPLIYVVILIITSLFLSRWTVMLLAFGSALTWWFFYLPKQWSLRITRTEDALMLGLFFVAAMACGHIASRLRARERGGIEGERNARTLYDLLRGLNESRDLEGEGLESAVAKVEIAFRAHVALLRPVPGADVLVPYPAGHLTVPEQEMAAAAWALQNRQWAGRETGNFPDAEATCVPLISGDRVCGVLVVQLAAGETWQSLQRELMESIARLVADMMVREETASLARDAQVAVNSQKMQRALVDNFSHEMQTPLSVVASAIQHLRRQGGPLMEQDVLREASIAVSRLSLVVNEMVVLARLDGGMLHPTLEWCDAGDFLREWRDSRTDASSSHTIRLSLPGQSVYIRLDPGLLKTPLDNVMDNALRHAPADTPIDVAAFLDDSQLRIQVTDRGPGIAVGQAHRLFERFYRGPGEAPGGLGLGLAVAKEFLELMGGTITAASPPGGGACFTISLPCVTELPQSGEPNP